MFRFHFLVPLFSACGNEVSSSVVVSFVGGADVFGVQEEGNNDAASALRN